MATYNIPNLPLPYDLETKAVLKQLNNANRRLAELKGGAMTIPNENIIVSTLTLQEAKDSSEVENIVTTQDDLYHGAAASLSDYAINAATKEVLNYREALQHGFHLVKDKGVHTSSVIKEICVHKTAIREQQMASRGHNLKIMNICEASPSLHNLLDTLRKTGMMWRHSVLKAMQASGWLTKSESGKRWLITLNGLDELKS